MIFAAEFLPLWLIIGSSLIASIALGAAILKAPWALIANNSERQHLVFGASILLGLFWLLRVEALQILTFHPLLMTTVTLMIGWHFAMLAGAIAQLVLLATGFDHWHMLGVNYLVTVIVPATVSYAAVKTSQRIALENIFVFLFGAGFLGAALCALAVAITTLMFLLLAGYDLSIGELANDAPLLLLLMFPEAFLNGTIVTAITVFKPHLMMTFNEAFYLGSSDKND